MGNKKGRQAQRIHHTHVPAVDLPLGQGIQCRKRLVQQHHTAGAEKRAQQRRALAHAAGKLSRVLCLRSLQAELRKIGLGLLPGGLLAFPSQHQRQRHIVEHPLMRQQQIFLQHVAD